MRRLLTWTPVHRLVYVTLQRSSRLQHWPELAFSLQCQQPWTIIAAANGLLGYPYVGHTCAAGALQ